MSSALQGATPGHGQEFSEGLHPHLELEKSMVHVAKVEPGDYVVWHCDSKCRSVFARMMLWYYLLTYQSHPCCGQEARWNVRFQRLVHLGLSDDQG